MSWASRRRAAYLSGVIAFFVIVFGVPAAYLYISSIPPTCAIGTMRPRGQTSGPCSWLDPRFLQPLSVLWARSFKVRDGSYTAVAYVENPNPTAGVQLAHYHLGLYDSQNVLIAEREGQMFIMPGQITPVLETGISTGNRVVVHTRFDITDDSLIWRKSQNPAASININNQSVQNVDTNPRIEAKALNTSLDTIRNAYFVAVAFDPAGNAFAASGTKVPELDPDVPVPIAFSWPEPFSTVVGRIDIIPLVTPVPVAPGTAN